MAGISFRLVRSPAAPKMTMMQGGFVCGFSDVDLVTAISVYLPLPLGEGRGEGLGRVQKAFAPFSLPSAPETRRGKDGVSSYLLHLVPHPIPLPKGEGTLCSRFDVPTKLLAHCRQNLFRERMFLTRAKSRVQGRRQNIRGHGLFESRLNRPATFAGILHKAGDRKSVV